MDCYLMAIIQHVVTDQGNGGAYCGTCQTDLGSSPMNIPNTCPVCLEKFTDSSMYINGGGSDF